MATTPGYDPKKAATFNQLRQGGLSEEAAAAQAGIPLGDGNYVISGKYNADGTKNPNPGTMGADVQGSAKVAGRDYDVVSAADQAENARFDRGLTSPSNFEKVDYQVEAKNSPSKVTPVNYTTTSTETVSGGGQTTTTAGLRTPNAASEAIQPKIAEKQAEINQFVKDNPSNFIRKKDGLPLLSESEQAAQDAKFKQLTDDRAALRNEQNNAKTPGTPTVTTVPNTTITTTTVTSGTTSADTAVAAPGGSDPVINQQTETNLGVAVGAANVQTAPADVPAVLPANDYPPLPVTPGPLPDWYTNPNATGPLDPPVVIAPALTATPADVNVGFGTDPTAGVLTPAAGTDGVANVDITGSPADVNPNNDPNTNVGSDGPSQAELLRNQNAQALASDPNTNTGNETANPNFAFNPDEEAERTNLNAAIKQGTLDKARAQNTIANQRRNPNNGDWRVKLRLAPGSTYLYNAPGAAGILVPLAAQGGVIFPYTPTIQTTYKATYSSHDLTHSNYRGYYYQGSQVDPVTLSCPFTAQSTVEAEYLLAVIHFFKSVTKMFYGQDAERGTPPPLVYLTGLGEFQFNEHPCVVQSFTYELPADVDYIRARSPNVNNSNMLNQRQASNGRTPGTTWGGGILGNVLGGAINRLANAGAKKGAMNTPPAPASFGQNSPTYVPTKINLSISLLPIQSRKQQSQQFSLKQYANGDLLKGGFW